jgi:uncharacterized protein (UPF0333 family)
MVIKKKRGQISLEFMLVFGIMMVLLLYSVKNITFSPGSASTDELRIQISLEEKNLANVISNTITQVYSQGPGAKATAYVRLTHLRDPELLNKGLQLQNPFIFITYGDYSDKGNGTYVAVIGDNFVPVFEGGNKNAFWSRSNYPAVLYRNSSTYLWSSVGSITLNGKRAYGLKISPEDLPSSLKIVVEWNPDRDNRWLFNQTAGELRININPGG